MYNSSSGALMLQANTYGQLLGSWPLKMANFDTSTVAIKCVSYGMAKALGYLLKAF